MEKISHQNVLLEIFSHLTAKSIYKIKSVDKSTSNLLQESRFVKEHVHNTLKRDDTCFLLQQKLAAGYNLKVMLYSLPGEQQSSGVSRDALRFLSNRTRVLCSCKGLILCRTTSKPTVELFICNPATKSWLSIPYPLDIQDKHDIDSYIMLLECHSSDDYMVLYFESLTEWSSNKYVCYFLKPGESTWKAMEKTFFVGNRNMHFDMPVHHNGTIHIISDCSNYIIRDTPYFEPYIMSYNLESGSSTMLKLPQNARKVNSNDSTINMRIFNWGKVSSTNSSICLVRLKRNVFKVWILQDYKSSSWTRILKARVQEMGLKEKRPEIKGFTVMNGDLLIFATKTRIYSCDLSDNNYMKIEEICKHKNRKCDVCFTPYLDTLRPCGPGATTLPC